MEDPSSAREPRASALRRLLRVAAPLALALPAAAHECWIQPSRFQAPAEERVELHLYVGKPGTPEAEERPRDLQRVNLFAHVQPGGEKEAVVGIEGKPPLGLIRPREAGLHTILYRTTYAYVEIQPDVYQRFLEEEGLTDVLAERKTRGESGIVGRDSYVRLCKTMVLVGDGPHTGFDQPTELAYEIVPVTDPFDWKAGEPFVVRTLVQGHPAPNRAVRMLRLEEPYDELTARTDAQGRATFEPQHGGAWGLFSIFQRRASSQLRGDWEGLWASLSLSLGKPESESAAKPADASQGAQQGQR